MCTFILIKIFNWKFICKIMKIFKIPRIHQPCKTNTASTPIQSQSSHPNFFPSSPFSHPNFQKSPTKNTHTRAQDKSKDFAIYAKWKLTPRSRRCARRRRSWMVWAPPGVSWDAGPSTNRARSRRAPPCGRPSWSSRPCFRAPCSCTVPPRSCLPAASALLHCGEKKSFD